MNRPYAIAVPTFDEGARLERFLRSTLGGEGRGLGGLGEIVVIDHRSTDATPEILDALRPSVERAGIRLRCFHEPRDFGPGFTMADLRAATVRACESEIVASLDADYVLGPRFAEWMGLVCEALEQPGVFGVGSEIVYVDGPVRFSSEGRIVEHATCYRHVAIPRVVWRDAVVFSQDACGGRYYRTTSNDASRAEWWMIPRIPESVLSINDKPPARRRLRATMNGYFASLSGPDAGGSTWHEAVAAGEITEQRTSDDYDHESHRLDVSLVGERYFARDAVATGA